MVAYPRLTERDMSLQKAVSAFGREAKAKLSNPVVSGAPEDQLRAPLETLASLRRFARNLTPTTKGSCLEDLVKLARDLHQTAMGEALQLAEHLPKLLLP